MTREGNELWYYDLNFQWIGQTNTSGNLGASFFPGDNTIRDLTFDGTHIWAINTSGTIRQFTKSGDLLGAFPDLLSGGWGLTFDGTYLWASNPGTDTIYKISLHEAVEGDVNSDGQVDQEDVVAILKHILDVQILEGYAFQQADCNGDEQINVFDALGIVNVILEFGSCGSFANLSELSPELMEFIQSLESYFSVENFSRCMDLIKTDLGVPSEYTLFQNYPNPFNTETEIAFGLPETVHVTITIYNALGQVVEVLVDNQLDPGQHLLRWNRDDAASGIYFYTIQANHFTDTKRMVLMK